MSARRPDASIAEVQQAVRRISVAVSTSQHKPAEPYKFAGHHGFAGQPEMGRRVDRLGALAAQSPAMRLRLSSLIDLAQRGLPRMQKDGAFVHTARSVNTSAGRRIQLEGDNLRYTTNVALGVACLGVETQRVILGGDTAADLAMSTVTWAEKEFNDPGAVALAAWAAAEAGNHFAGSLFARLQDHLASDRPIANVACSWTLIAALAARHLGDTRQLTQLARNKLIQAQGPGGLFPHMFPARSNGRLRAHVGSFADQVYSTMGLARLSVAENDTEALAAANASAERICALQGPAGQWWWHYDARNGSVVEGYPVYSVHQHAMGPMALLDLREAGGVDHMRSAISGL
jgi:hypothetical protein